MGAKSDRQKLVHSYGDLAKTMERLTELLRAQRKVIRKTQEKIANGAPIRDVFSSMPTGDLRQSMTDAMAEVEATRHEVRRLAFAVGLAEDMSIGELGRTWGFSRQLAARYAKEARGEL